MTHILHRHLRSTLPTAVGGHGIVIVDADGKEYLDASGGAAVSCLGHGHPDVVAAMRAQLDRIAYAHTSFFTTNVAEELADHLIAHAPSGMSHAYIVSGGSEAIEASLKLARQYFVEQGEPQRRHFIARRQSYHGNTLGALAVGGNEWRRRPFAPLLIDVTHVSPCYEYRDRRANESPEAYGERLALELDAAIERLGPENVIGFVAEPVVGATLGAAPPVPGYFRRIREICDRHGILLIADEVMCGMGRTGTLYALEQEGIAPDLATIAKGLGGGYQPIGAVLVAATDRRGARTRQRLFSARAYLPRPPGRVRRRARGATGGRARPPARCGEGIGRALERIGCTRLSATIRTSATSAAAVSSWRSNWLPTGRRNGRSIRRCACTPASSPRRWRVD